MIKKLLIVGISSNLGQSIYENIDRSKWEIVGTYNSRKPNMSDAKVYKCDITSTNDTDQLFRKVKKIDCIIIATGKSYSGSFIDTTAAHLHDLLNINVIGPFNIIKSSLSSLLPNSRVIIVSSLNGFLPLPNYSAYSASKHALDALVTSISYELFKKHIHLVIVSPGAFKNEKHNELQTSHKPLRQRIGIIRLLLPIPEVNEISRKIVDLVESSNNNSHVNIGRDSKLLWYMKKTLPLKLLEKIINI